MQECSDTEWCPRSALYTHKMQESSDTERCPRSTFYSAHTHTRSARVFWYWTMPVLCSTHARNARGPGLSFAGSFAAVDVVVVCCLFPVLRLKIVEVLDQKVRLWGGSWQRNGIIFSANSIAWTVSYWLTVIVTAASGKPCFDHCINYYSRLRAKNNSVYLLRCFVDVCGI